MFKDKNKNMEMEPKSEKMSSSDRKFPEFFKTFLSRTLLVSSMVYQMQEHFWGTPCMMMLQTPQKELMAFSYKSNFRSAKGSVFVCECVCSRFAKSFALIAQSFLTVCNLSTPCLIQNQIYLSSAQLPSKCLLL